MTPGSAESRSLLGRALFGLGLLYNPGPASIPLWQQALDHYEQDLAARPDDPQFQRNVALACKYFAGAYETAGRDEPALPLHRRALALDERRYAADPNNRTTQFDLAVSLSALATNVERARNHAEAAELYSKSLEIRERLADSDPKDVLSRGRLGYVQMRLAQVELDLGLAVRARERARAAVATHEEVLQKTKDNSSRRDLGGALYTLGEAERKLGQAARACLLFQRAAAFGATPASAYLDYLQRVAEAAHRACQTGKPSAAQ